MKIESFMGALDQEVRLVTNINFNIIFSSEVSRDLWANDIAENFTRCFLRSENLLGASILWQKAATFENLEVIFLGEDRLLELFVDLTDAEKCLDALLDSISAVLTSKRLRIERPESFLGILPFFLRFRTITPVMPFQQVKVIERLKTLEKVVSRLGAHLADHIEEMDITIYRKKSFRL